MAKTLMFKLRLDGNDRERLDVLAEHFSAPASTVLRILIKKEFDALRAAGTMALRSGPASPLPPEPSAPSRGRKRAPAPLIPTPETFVSQGAHALSEPPRKSRAKKRRSRTQ
jgi:hypothetical protein